MQLEIVRLQNANKNVNAELRIVQCEMPVYEYRELFVKPRYSVKSVKSP